MGKRKVVIDNCGSCGKDLSDTTSQDQYYSFNEDSWDYDNDNGIAYQEAYAKERNDFKILLLCPDCFEKSTKPDEVVIPLSIQKQSRKEVKEYVLGQLIPPTLTVRTKMINDKIDGLINQVKDLKETLAKEETHEIHMKDGTILTLRISKKGGDANE